MRGLAALSITRLVSPVQGATQPASQPAQAIKTWKLWPDLLSFIYSSLSSSSSPPLPPPPGKQAGCALAAAAAAKPPSLARHRSPARSLPRWCLFAFSLMVWLPSFLPSFLQTWTLAHSLLASLVQEREEGKEGRKEEEGRLAAVF